MAAGAPSLEVRGRATRRPSDGATVAVGAVAVRADPMAEQPGSWPLGGSVSTAGLSTRGNNPSSGSAVPGCLFLLVGEGGATGR